jgi:hypothetical protein
MGLDTIDCTGRGRDVGEAPRSSRSEVPVLLCSRPYVSISIRSRLDAAATPYARYDVPFDGRVLKS